MFGKRKTAPLYGSVQTRSAQPVGVLSFAFVNPWLTPNAPLGAGVVCGALRAEAGASGFAAQMGQTLSLGGLYAGTLALQPLSAQDYIYLQPRRGIE